MRLAPPAGLGSRCRRVFRPGSTPLQAPGGRRIGLAGSKHRCTTCHSKLDESITTVDDSAVVAEPLALGGHAGDYGSAQALALFLYPNIEAKVAGADAMVVKLHSLMEELETSEEDAAGRRKMLTEAIQVSQYLAEAMQMLIDLSEEELEGAGLRALEFQNHLIDLGALSDLVAVASKYRITPAWLTVQKLLFKNKRVAALMVKQELYLRVHEVLLSHDRDICDDNGNTMMPAAAPPHHVTAAAFVLSTLVVTNRQHSKLTPPAVLERVSTWIRGGDSSASSELMVLGRGITLRCRAISIGRDVAVNAAAHEDLIKAGIGEALLGAIAGEQDPRRKVGTIISVCMLVDPDKEDRLGAMSMTEDDFSLVMEAVQCSMSGIKCYGTEWRMWPLMLALHKLSIKDENRVMMLSYKPSIVELITTVLQGDHEMQSIVQRYAMLTCWNLCFEGQGLHEVKASPELLPLIKDIHATSNSPKVREAANGVLFTVGQRIAAREDEESDSDSDENGTLTKGKHIMISYEWSHQQRVLVLAKCLEDLGYNVWLDLQNMSGSTLEAMASAVEDSSIVICCVSRRYRNSQACRTEAEYAFQQRTRIIPVIFEKGFKPTGWLGALLGTRLYFSMYETYQVQSACKRLALEIGDTCKRADSVGKQFADVEMTPAELEVPETSQPREFKIPRSPGLATANPDAGYGAPPPARHLTNSGEFVFDIAIDDTDAMQAVSTWTPTEVNEWLTQSGLPEVGASWQKIGVDGLALQGLVELASDGSLRTSLRKDLRVTNPVHMLKIVACLGMLFNMGHK